MAIVLNSRAMSGRILVVGGAGCIGCRTVKQQLRSGFEVTMLDDLANGRSDPVLTDDFIEGDMSNRELLAGIFRTRHINSVMQFAASIAVGESVRNSRPSTARTTSSRPSACSIR
jgi:UDP-glucose 4-epimerase